MSHTLLTGIEGRVHVESTYANTQEWSITPADDIHKKITSATRGAGVRVKGIEKWSGSFSAYGAIPTILPGDAFTFTGVVAGDASGADTDTAVTGDARCNEVVININYETGEPMSHTVSFESNGALSYDDTTQIALDSVLDATDFLMPYGTTHLVKYDKSTAGDLPAAITFASTLADVRSITITLSRANPGRASSSTAGVEKHDSGIPDAKVSINVDEASAEDWWKIGELVALRAYVTASTWWEFKFLTVESLGDISIDPEDENNVNATYELSYSSIGSVDGTATAGAILQPSTTAWYPTP